MSCEIALRCMSLDRTVDKLTFVAWRHQAITWASVDPDRWHHMASLGPSELKETFNMSSNMIYLR